MDRLERVGRASLVGEMRRLLELTLPKNVRLKTQLAEDLPDVEIDAAQVRQAIVNLVQNAAQSMGDARGEVLVRTRLVERGRQAFLESFLRDVEEPSAGAAASLLELSVTDEGSGISLKDVGRVFEPFFTRRPGSRGLGLSGVLGIIHGHSGAIAIDTREGRGTTILLYFPVPATQPEEV